MQLMKILFFDGAMAAGKRASPVVCDYTCVRARGTPQSGDESRVP
jgi:hypothetical protein